jgi:ubiquinone/menaquinone biosynthesis C-methylase UbiE
MKALVNQTEFDSHVEEYEAWFESHPEIFLSEVDAIREHFDRLPENIRGIEVGLGTGRFSKILGIKEGVEPARAMAEKARKQGIEVMEARAEQLPYGDIQFDFVLLVTVCHLENVSQALREAKRVLKPGGLLIVAFLPKDRPVATEYQQRKEWSTFYKYAQFIGVDQLIKWVTAMGFKNLETNQTLFGPAGKLDTDQQPHPGSDIGSFVVISAIKH